MDRRWRFVGLAIVSADDRIADDGGATPDSLRNDADWAYFQDVLDRSDVTVLGRIGHEHNPNDKGRSRLILSSSSSGLEERADGWWWHPAKVAIGTVLDRLLPDGGSLAVPGGQKVFDLFLPFYESFHLSRAEAVVLGAGATVFSAVEPGTTAVDILQGAGLLPGAVTMLDPAANVTLTIYRRAVP